MKAMKGFLVVLTVVGVVEVVVVVVVLVVVVDVVSEFKKNKRLVKKERFTVLLFNHSCDESLFVGLGF